MLVYEQIVFMQGDDATEALDILDNKGIDGALRYLKQWHDSGKHDTRDKPSAGTSDRTHETTDGYILTWNNGLSYIGLEYKREIKNGRF